MCLLKKDFSFHRSACLVQKKYFSLQEQITSVQEKGNEYRIMSITNLSRSGTQTKTFRELLCSPSLVDGLQQESVSFAAVNIFLSQHFLGILLFFLPFIKNLPFTRRPNSCIVVCQQLICWLVLLLSLSMSFVGCLWFSLKPGAFVITQGKQPTLQGQHYVEFLC